MYVPPYLLLLLADIHQLPLQPGPALPVSPLSLLMPRDLVLELLQLLQPQAVLGQLGLEGAQRLVCVSGGV